ncbi:MAG: hypothetical protein CMJ47_04205 [Planctomyces sp.]|nr:hypothetical protein [Planctomyces sp.]
MKYSMLLAGLLAVWGGHAQAQSTTPAEIVTARREFSIPFRYDRRELNRIGARSVVLSVSRDAGASWKQVSSIAISENQFRFRATEDGSYWFSVAVQGADNQLHPRPDLGSTGLKVLVDHVKPVINLELTQPSEQQVQLVWNLMDATLDLTTLHMEYRYGPDDVWKQVYISALEQGKTSWKIPPGAVPEVRCRVADKAGNKAEQMTSVMPARQSAVNSAPQNAPAFGQSQSMPVAVPSAVSQKSSPAALPQISPAPAGKVRANRPDALPEIVSTPPAAASKQQARAMQPMLALPPETEASSDSVTQTSAAAELDGYFSEAKAVQNLAAESTEVDQLEVDQADSQPARPKLNFVPSRNFQIDYEVSGVGPSGVGVVEVFITQDNGGQWWRYGVDADRQSPVAIQVPADGRYGFCFRIHSGVGNAEPPPQPGDAPQVQLQVDSTAPHLKLLQTRQGRGSQLREVTVDWDHVDDNPTDAPVSVFVGGSSKGPWQLIDDQIVDRGSHTFQLPHNPPAQLFVKLQAIDRAGNRSEAVSAEPILLDLARPTARVLTVDPIR